MSIITTAPKVSDTCSYMLLSGEDMFRHFSFVIPRIFVIPTKYSQLSGLMMVKEMRGQLIYTDNPNFISDTPTGPLARHRLRNVLFSHTSLSQCAHTRARRRVTQGPNILRICLWCVILLIKSLLNETNKHARINGKPNNLHPDNREYTIYDDRIALRQFWSAEVNPRDPDWQTPVIMLFPYQWCLVFEPWLQSSLGGSNTAIKRATNWQQARFNAIITFAKGRHGRKVIRRYWEHRSLWGTARIAALNAKQKSWGEEQLQRCRHRYVK
jgi:hypothetical protein